MKKHPITVAYGDGIGPEIMEAVLSILKQAGAPLEIETIIIGEKVYQSGHPTGIDDAAWESLRRTKVFLKAPITTPQGGGYRSLNVTIRTSLGLFANIRPCVSYYPFIKTKHPKMDLIIVRENEEDLYTGIEYRQTPNVCQALKLISRLGCEKIIRYAFEYALKHGRKKVTVFTKDNILKMSDGLFHRIFDEIAKDYPHIQNEHWIVDIGAAKLADTPEEFDVIVLPNLYGDILSDVAAQISGSVGLAGSANIGEKGAMFEAIHGSAPKRANQNIANPSGLLHGAILMLVHLQLNELAALIHNAWLKTIEEGIHTYDIFKEGTSKKVVGTKEFANELILRLGQKPHTLQAVTYSSHLKENKRSFTKSSFPEEQRELVGCDVYLYSKESTEKIQKRINSLSLSPFSFTLLSNRGVRVWPSGIPETVCIEQWRARFEASSISQEDLLSLFQKLINEKFDIIKIENLYNFDKKPGFSNVEKRI